jgi:hypothetical protein
MVTKNEGYLTIGGSDADGTTSLSANGNSGDSTDGDDIGQWQEGSLFIEIEHGESSSKDLITLEIQSNRRDGGYVTDDFVSFHDVSQNTKVSKKYPLGGNSDSGVVAPHQWIKVVNTESFSLTSVRLEYETHTY